jgi:hypothetical protein
MVQGSTGGAGFTAGGFERIRNGQPLPLEATLVYLRRGGDRHGEIIGYDEVTVGGYGMASVSVDRQIVGDPEAPWPPRATPSPGASPAASSPASPTVTPGDPSPGTG